MRGVLACLFLARGGGRGARRGGREEAMRARPTRAVIVTRRSIVPSRPTRTSTLACTY